MNRSTSACPGDRPLDVEAQALLGAAGEKVQAAAHRPEKFLAAAEQGELARGEDAGRDQVVRVPHAVHVFRDPEEGVEVAQAPLAFLQVRLDQVARRAGALDPLLPFGELGRDEFGRRLGDDLLVKARPQRLEQLVVAGHKPRFDQRGADRHVGARLSQAFVDRSGGVADLLLEVPQHVEQRFDHLLDRRRGLVGQQEQEIDVRARRQHAATVSADRHDGRRRRPLRRREPARDELERDAQEVVDLRAQGLGAGPSRPARLERLAGLLSSVRQGVLEDRHRGAAKSGVVGGVPGAKRGKLVDEPCAVQTVAGGVRGPRGAGAAFDHGSDG